MLLLQSEDPEGPGRPQREVFHREDRVRGQDQQGDRSREVRRAAALQEDLVQGRPHRQRDQNRGGMAAAKTTYADAQTRVQPGAVAVPVAVPRAEPVPAVAVPLLPQACAAAGAVQVLQVPTASAAVRLFEARRLRLRQAAQPADLAAMVPADLAAVVPADLAAEVRARP